MNIQERVDNNGVTIYTEVEEQLRIISIAPEKNRSYSLPYSLTINGLLKKGSIKDQINYEYEGYNREVALILHEHIGQPYEQSKEILDARYRYGYISYDLLVKSVLYLKYCYEILTPQEYELEVLNLKYENKEISTQEFEKLSSTLKGEPWVHVEAELDANNPKGKGAFSLDWNSYFIDELVKNNYYGRDEEEIVEDWFQNLCNTVAKENELENIENSPSPKTIQTPKQNGKVDYS